MKKALTRKAHAPLKQQALLPASSLLKQQILSFCLPSTFNVLCVPSIKRKHTHKVAQLHVDTRKAYYLQERYHKERIVAGYVVEHTGNTKCHRFYERYPSPCHNGIEHPNDRLLCHVLRTSF